jgi:hypothetical protein
MHMFLRPLYRENGDDQHDDEFTITHPTARLYCAICALCSVLYEERERGNHVLLVGDGTDEGAKDH